MKPLRLRLAGFSGIRHGMGRDALDLDLEALVGDAQLVALVGPNGAGKSTILDNLQPYRLMPSHGHSIGGFSYYDHVCTPEAEKMLEWQHDGRRLRSHLVFRTNGARKTEAFLHEWQGGRWGPVVLPDGTRSDGKTDTYDRCVEGLLGSPETFFISAFHAQGHRHLSSYRTGEVKALLTELLGLDAIRELGRAAGTVLTRLEAHLSQQRQVMAQRRSLAAKAEQLARDQERLAQAVADALNIKEAAATRVQQAEQALREREAERAACRGTEALRQTLLAQARDRDEQRRRVVERAEQGRRALQVRSATARTTLSEVRSRIATARVAREADLRVVRRLLDRAEQIEAAVQRSAELAADERDAREALANAEGRAQQRRQIEQQLAVLQARRDGLEREAGAAVLQVRQLQQRLGLTTQVPCQGTSMQGDCPLLADARAAQPLLPSAEREVARLAQAVQALDAQRHQLASELGQLGEVEPALKASNDRLQQVIETRRKAQADASLASELPDARAREQGLRREIEEGEAQVAAAVAASTTEVAACEQALQALELQRGQELRDLDAGLAAIAERLGGLPPLPDPAIAAATAKAAQEAQQGLADAERRHIAAVSADAAAQGQLQVARAALDGMRDVSPAIDHLEAEVAMWSALSKGLGPDGVVALCIDDVGPTLSSLANDLLLSCYGPRFTVTIATQVESAKRELKEGFDIIVFDAHTDSAKSVSLMSGGERIWINAALTRAIAIYLAQWAGRKYQALFTDEADGPLDAEHKRMFVAMKREVLRLGGYEQEFWVSHTPELWTMADKVVDVSALALSVNRGSEVA